MQAENTVPKKSKKRQKYFVSIRETIRLSFEEYEAFQKMAAVTFIDERNGVDLSRTLSNMISVVIRNAVSGDDEGGLEREIQMRRAISQIHELEQLMAK